MRLHDTLRISMWGLGGLANLTEAAPRWQFDYQNYNIDPKPDILVLGDYQHPSTGNNLVGGINLNYLSPRAINLLRQHLPTIMGQDGLQARYNAGKLLLPQIFQSGYRTYNADHINSIKVSEFEEITTTEPAPEHSAQEAPQPANRQAPQPANRQAPQPANRQAPQSTQPIIKPARPVRLPTRPTQPQVPQLRDLATQLPPEPIEAPISEPIDRYEAPDIETQPLDDYDEPDELLDEPIDSVEEAITYYCPMSGDLIVETIKYD